MLKKNFQVIDAEDAAIAYLAALAGGQQLHVPPAAIKIITERYAILQVEDLAVHFHTWRSTGSPLLSIWRALVMWIDCAMGYEKIGLNGAVKMPGDADKCMIGRLSAYRHLNFTEFGYLEVIKNIAVPEGRRQSHYLKTDYKVNLSAINFIQDLAPLSKIERVEHINTMFCVMTPKSLYSIKGIFQVKEDL